MVGDEQYLGYIKYDGPLVEDGLMDAKQQARALLGLDQALRYFVIKQAQEFRNLDFEIPVRVRNGSWEVLIPETVGEWFGAGLGVVATAYFGKAAQKMAENDFAEYGVKDLFKTSIEAIKWFARIGKHFGNRAIKSFEGVEFSDGATIIGVKNSRGEILYVPKYILDLYVGTSPELLRNLVENVEEGRDLAIGTLSDEGRDEEIINNQDKHIFSDDEDELVETDEVLFPDLVHGEQVILEGEVTRENKTSNSMGFRYNDHILTAYPETNSIVQYKHLIFSFCRLYGVVSRLDEDGRIGSRRPKLIFSHLEPIDPGENYDLFADNKNV